LPCPSRSQDLNLALFLGSHHINGKAYHVLGKGWPSSFILLSNLR
jgi:hypothetical protein